MKERVTGWLTATMTGLAGLFNLHDAGVIVGIVGTLVFSYRSIRTSQKDAAQTKLFNEQFMGEKLSNREKEIKIAILEDKQENALLKAEQERGE